MPCDKLKTRKIMSVTIMITPKTLKIYLSSQMSMPH